VNKILLPLRALLAIFALFIWCAATVSLFYAARLISYSGLEKIPRLFHRGCCLIFGLSVTQGEGMSQHRPTLYVGNHISYLDVFVLGGWLPGYFIAKSDVASWPVLGQLAKLQNTLFFERNSKRAAAQISIMEQHLKKRGNLILFPEGTSTYGTSVRPFKSSLFKAAELNDVDVLIQPFAVSYTHCAGKPMSRQWRDYFAWYDEMPFGLHFVKALGAPTARVEVRFAEPVRFKDFESRKACAAHCWAQSSKMLVESLAEGDELSRN